MKISSLSNTFCKYKSDIYFAKWLKIEKENSKNINEVTPENKEFYLGGNFMQNLSPLSPVSRFGIKFFYFIN
jgi:hypothetical protein